MSSAVGGHYDRVRQDWQQNGAPSGMEWTRPRQEAAPPPPPPARAVPEWVDENRPLTGDELRDRLGTYRAPEDEPENTEYRGLEVPASGFLSRTLSRTGQNALSLFAGTLRAADAVMDIQDAPVIGPLISGDWLLDRSAEREDERESLRDTAGTVESLASAPVEGALTTDDVEANWLNVVPWAAQEFLPSVATMPLLANPYTMAGMGVSMAGSIGQARAENNGRDRATLGDVAAAAPYAGLSLGLDRAGLDTIFNPGVGNIGMRYVKGMLGEGGTEGVQGFMESAGGTVGTERGFNLDESLDNAKWGAILGATASAGVRTGIEIADAAPGAVDRVGRFINTRAPGDTRTPPPGVVEQAEVTAAQPTQADIDSPIPTEIITGGRAEVARGQASTAANQALSQANMPEVGREVEITYPNGRTERGTVADFFAGDEGAGVVIDRVGSPRIREFFDNINDAGIQISEAQPRDKAAVIADKLAAAPDVSPISAIPADPALISPIGARQEAPPPVAEAAPREPVADGGAIIRSIFGDTARITSTRRGPNDALTQANPRSWHARSNAAVDIAPIPGMTFEQARSAIEAQGFTLIEALNETGSGRSRHATGDHWHFVIGTGGTPASAASAPSAPTAPPAPFTPSQPLSDMPEINPAIAPQREREEAVQDDMFGGPSRTESEVAARDSIQALVEEVRREEPDVDLERAYEVLTEARRTQAETVRRGFERGPLDEYIDRADSLPLALTFAANRNPAIIDALGERILGRDPAGVDQNATIGRSRQQEPIDTLEGAPIPSLRTAATNFATSLFGTSDTTIQERADYVSAATGSVPLNPSGDAARRGREFRDAYERGEDWTRPADLNEVAEPSAPDGSTDTRPVEVPDASPIAQLRWAQSEFDAGRMSPDDLRPYVDRFEAERTGGTQSQDPASTTPALQNTAVPEAQPAPASAARIEESSSGKGIVLIGASEAELAAIASAVPNAKATPPRKSDGGVTYSKKYEAEIRAAMDGATQSATPNNGDARNVTVTASNGQRVDAAVETVIPSQDTRVGTNAAGDPLYERGDGTRYRVRADNQGRPDFGGDLAPVEGSQDAAVAPQAGGSTLTPATLATNVDVRVARDNFTRALYGSNQNATAEAERAGFNRAVEARMGNQADMIENIPAEVRNQPGFARGWADGNGWLNDVTAGRLKTTLAPDMAVKLGKSSSAQPTNQDAAPELVIRSLQSGAETTMALPPANDPLSPRERAVFNSLQRRNANGEALDDADMTQMLDLSRKAQPPSPRADGNAAEGAADTARQDFEAARTSARAAGARDWANNTRRQPPAEWASKGANNPFSLDLRTDWSAGWDAANLAAPMEGDAEYRAGILASNNPDAVIQSSRDSGANFPSNNETSPQKTAQANEGRKGQNEAGNSGAAAAGPTPDSAAPAAQGAPAQAPVQSKSESDQSAAPATYGSKNKAFTQSRAEAARAVLRAKRNQLNAGFDPEIAQAGLTLMGYHMEAGARAFIDASRAVAADLDMTPAQLRNNLRSWYMSARMWFEDNGQDVRGMDDDATVRVDLARIDQWGGEKATAPANDAIGATNDPQPSITGATDQTGDAREGSDDVRRTDGERGDQSGDSGPRESGAGDRSRDNEPVAGRDTDLETGVSGERAADGRRAQRGEADRARSSRGVRRGKPARPDGAVNYNAPANSLARQGGWKATAERNLDIIELVNTLDAEGRPATAEEQVLLAKFTGWGAGEIRNNLLKNTRRNEAGEREIVPAYYGEWKEITERAARLLKGEDLETALQSTQYAHYTSEPIIRSIWDGLDRLGFKGGKILEPGMGIGLFAVAAPESAMANSHYTGIELDKFTAKVAGYLLPQETTLAADFVKQRLPDGFFDGAIGNPPFSATKVMDDPAYRRHRLSLHDYFFAKSIDKIRPGGLMVFVTSRYTMDKLKDQGRKYIADRADLLGAIRLPQTAFKENAGTEVVTDVLFFQKRVPGAEPAGQSWLGVDTVKAGDQEVRVNEYFAANPGMVLGDHATTGSMYRSNEYTVTPLSGDIAQHFAKAIGNLPQNVYTGPVARAAEAATAKTYERDMRPASEKEGGLYISDGKVYVRDQGTGVQVESLDRIAAKDIPWLKDYVGVRDALKTAQKDQLLNGDWEASLKALNKAYDAFVKKHGQISAFTKYDRTTTNEDGDEKTTSYRRYKNERLLRADVEGILVENLEKITDDDSIVKGPFLLGRTLNKPVRANIETTQDALAVSLDEIGKFDLDYIAGLTKQSRDEVIASLGDGIYMAPDGVWQLADEYLSGDVVRSFQIHK